ncbi:hypothetical protein QOT17_007462 [Balamuthia mandrillaris]
MQEDHKENGTSAASVDGTTTAAKEESAPKRRAWATMTRFDYKAMKQHKDQSQQDDAQAKHSGGSDMWGSLAERGRYGDRKKLDEIFASIQQEKEQAANQLRSEGRFAGHSPEETNGFSEGRTSSDDSPGSARTTPTDNTNNILQSERPVSNSTASTATSSASATTSSSSTGTSSPSKSRGGLSWGKMLNASKQKKALADKAKTGPAQFSNIRPEPPMLTPLVSTSTVAAATAPGITSSSEAKSGDGSPSQPQNEATDKIASSAVADDAARGQKSLTGRQGNKKKAEGADKQIRHLETVIEQLTKENKELKAQLAIYKNKTSAVSLSIGQSLSSVVPTNPVHHELSSALALLQQRAERISATAKAEIQALSDGLKGPAEQAPGTSEKQKEKEDKERLPPDTLDAQESTNIRQTLRRLQMQVYRLENERREESKRQNGVSLATLVMVPLLLLLIVLLLCVLSMPSYRYPLVDAGAPTS